MTGSRLQAASFRPPKPQAGSCRLEAAGYRLQATGCRLQAAGYKLQATGCKLQATSNRAATSYSLQATGHKQQATSYRLQKQFAACIWELSARTHSIIFWKKLVGVPFSGTAHNETFLGAGMIQVFTHPLQPSLCNCGRSVGNYWTSSGRFVGAPISGQLVGAPISGRLMGN